MTLTGKTVLVTGASRGIGAAIVAALSSEGATVVASARTKGVVDLAERLRSEGRSVETLLGDVADESHVKALIQLCRSRFGKLDALVNNAGILTGAKLGMARMEDVRRMLEVNVVAMINLTQYAIRLFPKDGGGSVINLASIAGTRGIDGLSAYSASKAAVVGFTLAAAKELAPRHIRVNAIAPGFIDTDMARQISPDWFRQRVESIRIGRIGEPADVARCAVFLASDASAYITGQVIGVDGAMTV